MQNAHGESYYNNTHFKLRSLTDGLVYELTTIQTRAVVVAQLVERSLPTPEIRSSNPVTGVLLYRTFDKLLSTV